MRTYYPVATAKDGHGNIQTLTTYDGLLSIAKCTEQFELWREAYKYLFDVARIQVVEDGKVLNTLIFEYYKNEWLEID